MEYVLPFIRSKLSDSAVYNSGITMIRNAKTANDFKQAAAYFEELSEGNPSHWLSLYYAALCYIQASHRVEEDKERDEMLDKAQPLIDKAGKNESKGTGNHGPAGIFIPVAYTGKSAGKGNVLFLQS